MKKIALLSFLAASVALLIACNQHEAKPAEKTVIDTPVVSKPPSPLALAEKDLDYLKTMQETNDNEIQLNMQELNVYIYAYTIPSAKEIDKQIAKEKAEISRKAIEQYKAKKLELTAKRIVLEHRIDSLRKAE